MIDYENRFPHFKITREQREALLRKYNQNSSGAKSYREFRGRVRSALGYIMIPWCGMWLGIETDGYTHS
jgi:hypothetical protein